VSLLAGANNSPDRNMGRQALDVASQVGDIAGGVPKVG